MQPCAAELAARGDAAEVPQDGDRGLLCLMLLRQCCRYAGAAGQPWQGCQPAAAERATGECPHQAEAGSHGATAMSDCVHGV